MDATKSSPVVSNNSDLSSPEEEKCILGTSLSDEFDPLNWKMDDLSKNSNGSDSNCATESKLPETPALNDDVCTDVDVMTVMTDSKTSCDLLTFEENANNEVISESKPTPALCVSPEDCTSESLHITSNSEPFTWPSNVLVHVNDANTNGANAESDTSTSTPDYDDVDNVQQCATNPCSIVNSNTNNDHEPVDSVTIESANFVANKIVNECLEAMHDGLAPNTCPLPNRSSSVSPLSDNSCSDSDESVESGSSGSSGPSRRIKRNIKNSNGAQSTPKTLVSHELPLTTNITDNSTEENKKFVDTTIREEYIETKKTDAVSTEMNGHAAVNSGDKCSAFVKSDNKETVLNEAFITGVCFKTLKNQYVNHVQHEAPIVPAYIKETINTGIDFKSLKSSYVLTAKDNVASKNAINKELIRTGVNINSIKWTFNGRHENGPKFNNNNDYEKISTGISVKNLKCSFNSNDETDDGVTIDKAKVQSKFIKMEPYGCDLLDNPDNPDTEFTNCCGIKDDTSLCKMCGKHVYQMEKIKAEKSVFHKSCFRCKECNKQLIVDNYSSHEGQLYCTPHFKHLFQPKAKFDGEDHAPTANCDGVIYNYEMKDDNKGRQKKYEMIVRENTPLELPPEVVRSNAKIDDPIDNLHLNLSNIRQRFESNNTEENHRTAIDKNSLRRSESLIEKMQRYQSAASGEKTCDSSSSDVSDDEKGHSDPRNEEEICFSGMSTLKSQWESGSMSATKEHDEGCEELNDLRQKMGSGRAESLKHQYERACEESNSEVLRTDSVILDSPVKTGNIKERFETGHVYAETEEEKIERLKKEREEELLMFNETETASKEARNIFKQIDASATRGPLSPPLTQSNNPFKHDQRGPQSPTICDVVRCGDPIIKDDIDAEVIHERFSYFENYKETSKEPKKRFEMTPPREVNEVIVENDGEKFRDPNVIRSCDVVDDIPKVDTARKMLDKFKSLENHNESQQTGPKPMKRITPPRESATDNDPNHRELSPERDPNIIRSTYKTEEEVPVEPEKARSLKAKFENWALEIDKEKKNCADDDDEYAPHIDTTKNLRAKFEAIKDENNKPSEKPKARVNRFVQENSATERCSVCGTRIYPMEKMELSGTKMHKNCFKCAHCSSSLRLDNYTISAGKLYCIPHFKQLFMAKGNYDEGFGREQHKDKWTHKSGNNNNNDDKSYKRLSNGKSDENDNAHDTAQEYVDFEDEDY